MDRQRETPGELIRTFREATGHTQRSMAEKFGVTRVSWNRYEQRGAPRWMRYALAGYALMHADMIPSTMQVHVNKIHAHDRHNPRQAEIPVGYR